MLASELNGEIHASDIADIIKNGLEYCPEIAVTETRGYPTLSGLVIERSKSDRRCRCALYQEMVSLYNTFYELNQKNVNHKNPINMPTYCVTVKVSVIGVEFKDKLLRNFKLPELLGHANQPELGQSLPKQTAAGAYHEIC